MISLIVAHDKNNLIGSNGRLPWYISADLKRFKSITEGNIVLMGRKTYESIGKPLPKRINVVISNNRKLYIDKKCMIYNNPEHFLDYVWQDTEIFIIGGAELYKTFLPHANKLYVTYVDHTFEGDTYFPDYKDNFTLVESVQAHDDSVPSNYYFQTYIK